MMIKPAGNGPHYNSSQSGDSLAAPTPEPQAQSDSGSSFSRVEDLGSSSPYARTVSAEYRLEFSDTTPTGPEAAEWMAQIRAGRLNSRVNSIA